MTALCLALALFLQTPVFRSETSLALVRFLVVRKHACVNDLRREDVVVLEDGAPRALAVFEGGRSTPRTIPIEVMLLFDTSGSVTSAGLLDPLAYQSVLLEGLPGVRVSVYAFDSTLRRYCRPTRDPALLATALQKVVEPRAAAGDEAISLHLPPGRKGVPATWLFESMTAAARDVASAPDLATRMLVVFSDGFPTTNTRPEEAAAALSEAGIVAYPVLLGHAHIAALKEQGRLGWPEMAEMYMADFARLAELTGGRSFDPPAIDTGVVRQILSALAGQVACEYVAGFPVETAEGAPRQHRIEVKLRSRELGAVSGGMRTIRH